MSRALQLEDSKTRRLNVDRVPEGGADCFVDSFRERRVGMDGRLDLLVGCLEIDRQSQLRNHLGGFWADDMRAEDFAVRLTDEQFHESFVLADRAGFAARHE